MQSKKNDLLNIQVGQDGIALVTIDQINNPANLFSTEFIQAYITTANQAIADDSIKGVIITSGRRMFMAGADLRALGSIKDSTTEELLKNMLFQHQGFRAIETAGKPFVAALNGTALGGGLELALACHYRIALDDPKIKLGLPESKVGLFPGGGGTVKTPYLMGVQNALMLMLSGHHLKPQQALKQGLINDIAQTKEELIQKAKSWILANPNPIQPWDNKRHKNPRRRTLDTQRPANFHGSRRKCNKIDSRKLSGPESHFKRGLRRFATSC